MRRVEEGDKAADGRAVKSCVKQSCMLACRLSYNFIQIYLIKHCFCPSIFYRVQEILFTDEITKSDI